MKNKIIKIVALGLIVAAVGTTSYAAGAADDRTTISNEILTSEGRLVYDADPTDGKAPGEAEDDIYLESEDILMLNRSIKNLHTKYVELYKKVYGTEPTE